MAPESEVYSAGSNPTSVKREAIAVLGEVGIDASAHYSKGIADVPADRIDVVITLCAEEYCPAPLVRARRLHWPIPDPSDLNGFRRARDDIQQRLEKFFEEEGLA